MVKTKVKTDEFFGPAEIAMDASKDTCGSKEFTLDFQGSDFVVHFAGDKQFLM